jgi:hypothetical protein
VKTSQRKRFCVCFCMCVCFVSVDLRPRPTPWRLVSSFLISPCPTPCLPVCLRCIAFHPQAPFLYKRPRSRPRTDGRAARARASACDCLLCTIRAAHSLAAGPAQSPFAHLPCLRLTPIQHRIHITSIPPQTNTQPQAPLVHPAARVCQWTEQERRCVSEHHAHAIPRHTDTTGAGTDHNQKRRRVNETSVCVRKRPGLFSPFPIDHKKFGITAGAVQTQIKKCDKHVRAAGAFFSIDRPHLQPFHEGFESIHPVLGGI